LFEIPPGFGFTFDNIQWLAKARHGVLGYANVYHQKAMAFAALNRVTLPAIIDEMDKQKDIPVSATTIQLNKWVFNCS
jgi:hypothetical protein